MNITADRMDALERENKIIFQGNVIIQQDETYIRADRISAFLAGDDSGSGIQKVVALRNVRITEKDHVATCDRAEFDNVSRVIELSGNPKIWQGKDRIDGDKVILNLGEERVTITGSENRRVFAVLFPKTGDETPKKPEAPSGPRPSFSAPFAQSRPDVPSAEAEPETAPEEKPARKVQSKPEKTESVKKAAMQKPAPEPVKTAAPVMQQKKTPEAAILAQPPTRPLPVMRSTENIASGNAPGILSEGVKQPKRMPDRPTTPAPDPRKTEPIFKPVKRAPAPVSASNLPSSSRSFDLQQPYRPVRNAGIRPLDVAPSPKKNSAVAVLSPKPVAPPAPAPAQANEQAPSAVVEKKITAAEDEAVQATKAASEVEVPKDRTENIGKVAPSEDVKDRTKAAARKKPKHGSTLDESVEDFVERWRRAWESLDIGAYMAFYADDFRGSGKDKAQWRSHKVALLDRYSSIRVELEDMNVAPTENGVHVTFVQKYKADRFGDVGIKDLFVRKNGDRWEIVKEGWKPLKEPEQKTGTAVAFDDKKPEPASTDPPDERKTLRTLLDRWRLSWQNRDQDQHFSFYSKRFRSGTSDLAHWRFLRAQKMNRTKTISVGITNIKIVIRDRSAFATFVQDYQADRYRDRGIKSLRFQKEQGEWRIVEERWRPL